MIVGPQTLKDLNLVAERFPGYMGIQEMKPAGARKYIVLRIEGGHVARYEVGIHEGAVLILNQD